MTERIVSKDSRGMRSAQLIYTYGPGAIYTTSGSESFVICTIDRWHPSIGEKIELLRLSERLTSELNRQIDHFISPSMGSGDDHDGGYEQAIPALRFPRWLFCGTCLKMKFWKHSDEQALESHRLPTCSGGDGKACGGTLIPVRYVLACASGHLQDVDWPYLVHRGHSGDCRAIDALSWRRRSRHGGAGLRSEVLECAACNSSISIEEIYGQRARASGLACRVKQPWQEDRTRDPGPGCEEIRVMHRAGQNLHQPIIRRAIDIPPEAFLEASPVAQMEDFRDLVSMVKESGASPATLYGSNDEFEDIMNQLCLDSGDSEERIFDQLDYETRPPDLDASLLEGEYRAFVEAHQPREDCTDPRFVVTKHPLDREDRILGYFRDLRVIDRLREVSAITHFTRIRDQVRHESEEERDNQVEIDLGSDRNAWLPAAESYGEGIFLGLDPELLKSWWSRCGNLVTRRFEELLPVSVDSPFVEARYRVVHTLSHLLIRALSHRCGYSAASLSERIYTAGGLDDDIPQDHEMAGFLIYTTSGDLDGSMGGLAREGHPDRLGSSLEMALESARWCSTDPICSSTAQGRGGENLAACRSCSLLPETSCSNFNVQLDRQLLIDEEFGFFRGLHHEGGER
jgi:hypothetical protein